MTEEEYCERLYREQQEEALAAEAFALEEFSRESPMDNNCYKLYKCYKCKQLKPIKEIEILDLKFQWIKDPTKPNNPPYAALCENCNLKFPIYLAPTVY